MSNHVEDRPAFVGDERMLGERSRKQSDSLFDLAESLLPQALLVEGISTQQVVAERSSRPDPELGAPLRVDAVAHGKDGVEVEVLDLVGLAVRGSCCIFCNNCLSLQFPGSEDVPQVPRNHRLVAPEEFRHLGERQPDRLLLQPHVQADFALGGSVQNDLAASASSVLPHGAADAPQSASLTAPKSFPSKPKCAAAICLARILAIVGNATVLLRVSAPMLTPERELSERRCTPRGGGAADFFGGPGMTPP